MNAKGGFTLVELMVSLTVFSIVMTISTGTLLVLIDLNSKAQALYSATTNLSFALDSMTREMRTGYRYHCAATISSGLPLPPNTANCSNGAFVAFTREEDAVRMGYRLNTETHAIEQKVSNGNWVAITASDVYVDTFQITVANSGTLTDGTGTDRQAQPSVDVLVEGHVNNGLDTETDFLIQTHILQRRLDII